VKPYLVSVNACIVAKALVVDVLIEYNNAMYIYMYKEDTLG